MSSPIESKIIFHNLYKNDEYTKRVFPFLKNEYFHEDYEKKLFEVYSKFIVEYNSLPNNEYVEYEIQNMSIGDNEYRDLKTFWEDIKKHQEEVKIDWLIDMTEQFCKDKAIYNALTDSISIANNETTKSKNEIPDLLKDALSVSFDTNIGHDYFDNDEERYEYYHKVESKVPFDIDKFNHITQGGFSLATLNLFVGGTHTGKTLFLCHFAANYLSNNLNVLYLSLEMAEEDLAKRIDANLMDVSIKDIDKLQKPQYLKKIKKIKEKSNGKLIIKRYPPSTATVNHFRALLSELELKKEFVPDVIIIDYLGIVASSRFKSAENSYSYFKSVAEEIRGLAVEKNLPIISAVQTNRSGQRNSDVDFDNVSESHGISMTADFFAAIIASDEYKEKGQVMIKQLKNRYTDFSLCNKFAIGVDREKMRLYDIDDKEQTIPSEGSVNAPKANSNKKTKKIKGMFSNEDDYTGDTVDIQFDFDD